MNYLEETLDLLVDSVSVDWSASEDEGAIDERLQLSCQVVVKRQDQKVLGSFTDRYRKGWVTLMPSHGDRARNDKDQPVVGILFQRDEKLCLRILVNPTYLAGLATLIRGHMGPPIEKTGRVRSCNPTFPLA